MTTKIKLFDVLRRNLGASEKQVNDFLETKKEVTKVFISPGYENNSPVILVVYEEGSTPKNNDSIIKL